MSLANILEINNTFSKKDGISEERLMAIMPKLRDAIAFWREYPDIFVDFLCGEENPENFNLFFYQRVFLRQVMRHRYAYATYPRAYSKSFLALLVLSLRCILYPGSSLFVTTGGKDQAAGIAAEKMGELCKLIPGLRNEIMWDRGQSKTSKDNLEFLFKNGSKLNVMAAKQSSRGRRATGGLIEEVILVDGMVLNEIVIPTMNVDRRLADGSRHKEESVNKSQVYVTTAGWKNTFAYDKLLTLLIQSVVYPEEAVVMGGTWRVPVMEGLLNRSFVDELKLDGTYNEASFQREYESVWGGDAENAFFSSERLDRQRVLNLPEYEYTKSKTGVNSYYVISVDVGRKGCASEALVWKISPQPQGSSLKSLVNIFTFDDEHFEDQAIGLKKLYYRYKARRLVIDANGLGIGLVDYMVKSQIDPDSGDIIPDFGVYNDNEGFYKQFRTAATELEALYLVKANAAINTEAFTYIQTQLSSGKIKLLIDESKAKQKLLSTKVGENMSLDQRAEYLIPFTRTSILRDQMLNLVEENEGINIILKQKSIKIKKDKFSAMAYGLYYIKQEEDKGKKRKRISIKDFMFFT